MKDVREQRDIVVVIVPVYNCVDTLAGCVASIRAQTYPALEILLVNDGSEDGSAALCDALAAEDGRITVIHQENKGVSAARNRGIEAAQGEWIGFVDADDKMYPEMVDTLLGLATAYGAKVAMGNFCRLEGERVTAHELSDFLPAEEGVLRGEQRYRGVLPGDGFESNVWNKIYHHSLFTKAPLLRFDPSLTLCEDRVFTLRMLEQAEVLAYTKKVCYQYTIRPGSLSRAGWQTEINSLLARAEVIRLAPPPHNAREKAQVYTMIPRLAYMARQSGEKGIYRKLRDDFRLLGEDYVAAYKNHAAAFSFATRLLLRLASACFGLGYFAWGIRQSGKKKNP